MFFMHGGFGPADATRYDAGEVVEGDGGLIYTLVPVHLYTLEKECIGMVTGVPTARCEQRSFKGGIIRPRSQSSVSVAS